MAEGETVPGEEDFIDPDEIEANPPPEAVDLKLHFQSGDQAGLWAGFDDRGVPHLNAKGKKLTRKEKELVETEYMAAKKKCQQQLKAWDDWEHQVSQAERALAGRDRIRWAYRAVGNKIGNKHEILQPEDLKGFAKKMGWDALGKEDHGSFEKAVAPRRPWRGGRSCSVRSWLMGDGREQVHLEDIRSYIAGEMPQHFLQHRMDHFFRTLGKEWSRMMDCVPNVVPAEASRFARCSLSWLTLAHHKPKVRYEHVED
ncbi:unnamed protein product [Durusdinium trenchii]|uniref:Uncharacterized protein n=1 Tax=Durusdinium trenchii TaxID=1381693 RepID=A0ABP0MYR2_9DINO